MKLLIEVILIRQLGGESSTVNVVLLRSRNQGSVDWALSLGIRLFKQRENPLQRFNPLTL
jgi:hypothetical protein